MQTGVGELFETVCSLKICLNEEMGEINLRGSKCPQGKTYMGVIVTKIGTEKI
jgi:hypothetical protein